MIVERGEVATAQLASSILLLVEFVICFNSNAIIAARAYQPVSHTHFDQAVCVRQCGGCSDWSSKSVEYDAVTYTVLFVLIVVVAFTGVCLIPYAKLMAKAHCDEMVDVVDNGQQWVGSVAVASGWRRGIHHWRDEIFFILQRTWSRVDSIGYEKCTVSAQDNSCNVVVGRRGTSRCRVERRSLQRARVIAMQRSEVRAKHAWASPGARRHLYDFVLHRPTHIH